MTKFTLKALSQPEKNIIGFRVDQKAGILPVEGPNRNKVVGRRFELD